MILKQLFIFQQNHLITIHSMIYNKAISYKLLGSVSQFSHLVTPDSLQPHELSAHQASLSITNSQIP